jgi:hypothetical protein
MLRIPTYAAIPYMSDTAYNPCITCGACCAYFRASFHWSETEPSLGGTVPAELTEKISEHCVAMSGTNCSQPRCTALQGEIGKAVQCNIYPQRSSSCREFPYAWENNQPHDRCDKARAAHGLAPLQPQIIFSPPTLPTLVTPTHASLPPAGLLIPAGENTPPVTPV